MRNLILSFLIWALIIAGSVLAQTTPSNTSTIPVVTLDEPVKNSAPAPALAKPVAPPVVTLKDAKPIANKQTTTKSVVKKVPAKKPSVKPAPPVVQTPVASPAPVVSAKPVAKTKPVKIKTPKKQKPVKEPKKKPEKKKAEKSPVKQPKKEPVKKQVKEPTAKKVKVESKSVVADSHLKGKVSAGISGLTYLEYATNNALYLTDADERLIRSRTGEVENTFAAGFGAIGFMEYGFSDKVTGSLNLGYSRLTYSRDNHNLVNENFFTTDVLGNYYFLKNSKRLWPYASAGAGVIIGGSVMPTFDVGGGLHWFLQSHLSLKAQLLLKTAIVYNRIEPSLGIAYHFK